MGDFNARLGPRGERQALTDMMPTNHLPDVSPFASYASQVALLPPRASQDAGAQPNGSAGPLLELCVRQGLCVVNGRVPGDAGGSFTFSTKRKKGFSRSQPDLVLAPLGWLVPSPGEAPRVDMRVDVQAWSIPIPTWQSGMKGFDHAPVTVTVALAPAAPALPVDHQGEGIGPGGGGLVGAEQPVPKVVWESARKGGYVESLRREGGDPARLLAACLAATGVGDAAATLSAAMVAAAKRAGMVRSAGVRKGAPRSDTRPRRQPWFDRECGAARAAMYRARGAGRDSPAAQEATRQYWRVLNARKRQYEEEKLVELADQSRHDAKAFWGRVHERKAGATVGTLEGWTAHFTETLAGADPLPGDALQAHIQQFPDLFPEPTQERLDQARGPSHRRRWQGRCANSSAARPRGWMGLWPSWSRRQRSRLGTRTAGLTRKMFCCSTSPM